MPDQSNAAPMGCGYSKSVLYIVIEGEWIFLILKGVIKAPYSLIRSIERSRMKNPFERMRVCKAQTGFYSSANGSGCLKLTD